MSTTGHHGRRNRSAAARSGPIAAFVLGMALLSGCAALFTSDAPPPNYYVLSPIDAAAPASVRGPVLAVAPVQVPQYLSQKSIVTRTGANEVVLAPNDLWAGPLGDNITSVLAENLSSIVPSNRVVVLPVSAAVPVDYEVRVEIVSFERSAEGNVDLIARWMVFADGGRRLTAIEKSALRIGAVASDYPAITAAMSRLLAELSRDIATTLGDAPGHASISASRQTFSGRRTAPGR
jgi:uncharacterized protein